MLIVTGSFTVEADQRHTYLEEQIETMRRTRGEAGCLEYTFAADPLEDDRVILSERWEDQASLDKHVENMRAAPRPEGPRVRPSSVEITVYEISGSRKLA